MAFNDVLAQTVRDALAGHRDIEEKRMFGGAAFMARGHMCCGVAGNDLVVRVGPEGYEAAVAEPHARRMDFTGRPVKGFVYVAPDGVKGDADLGAWVARGLGFAESLPPKKTKPKKTRR